MSTKIKEKITTSSLTNFLRLVSRMKRRNDVIQACKNSCFSFQRFDFSGSCNGSSDNVSYTSCRYNTTANGKGDYFYRSSKKCGETVEYDCTEWIVIWNGYSAGDASSFDEHTLVIVLAEEAIINYISDQILDY